MVAGGNAVAGNARARILDASVSFDPDGQSADPLRFAWACAAAPEPDPGLLPPSAAQATAPCRSRGQPLALPNSSVVTLPPLAPLTRYFFSLTLSKAASDRETRLTVWLSVRRGDLPLVVLEAREPLAPTPATGKASFAVSVASAAAAAADPADAGRRRRGLLQVPPPGAAGGLSTAWAVAAPATYASLLTDPSVRRRLHPPYVTHVPPACAVSPPPPPTHTPRSLCRRFTVVPSPPLPLLSLCARHPPQLWAVPQTSPTLVLKPNALPPGQTLTLRITASEGASAAAADLVVATGVPPKGRLGAGASAMWAPAGSIAVSRSAGEAMSTLFNFSTSGWATVAPPISYRFSFLPLKGPPDAAETPLGDWSPFPFVVAKLPAGDPVLGPTRLTVRVRARSALKAVSAAAEVSVTVGWGADAAAGPTAPAAVAGDPRHQLLLGNPAPALMGVLAVTDLLDALQRASGADGAAERAATRLSLIQARRRIPGALLRRRRTMIVILSLVRFWMSHSLTYFSAELTRPLGPPNQTLRLQVISDAMRSMQMTEDTLNLVASAIDAATSADLSLGALALVLDIVEFVAGAGALVTPATAGLCVSALDTAMTGLQASPDRSSDANEARVFGILGALGASVQQGFAAPGEDAVAISTPLIQVAEQLDFPSGAGNRLFAQPLTVEGSASTFDPMPPGLLDGAGLPAGAAVRTSFLALAFQPFLATAAAAAAAAKGAPADEEAAAAAAATAVAPSLTQLKFSSSDGGGELAVAGLAAPVRFTMPAAPPGPDGAGAVCLFWSPQASAFRGEGCFALPSPLPRGHRADWLPPPPGGGAPPPRAPAAAVPFRPAADPSLCSALEVAGPAPAAAGGAAPSPKALSVAWSLVGPLFCPLNASGVAFNPCNVTVLDCSAVAAKADAAARRAAAAGQNATAAAEAVRKAARVFLSPRDAILVPPVSCKAGDNTTVMRIFIGAWGRCDYTCMLDAACFCARGVAAGVRFEQTPGVRFEQTPSTPRMSICPPGSPPLHTHTHTHRRILRRLAAGQCVRVLLERDEAGKPQSSPARACPRLATCLRSGGAAPAGFLLWLLTPERSAPPPPHADVHGPRLHRLGVHCVLVLSPDELLGAVKRRVKQALAPLAPRWVCCRGRARAGGQSSLRVPPHSALAAAGRVCAEDRRCVIEPDALPQPQRHLHEAQACEQPPRPNAARAAHSFEALQLLRDATRRSRPPRV